MYSVSYISKSQRGMSNLIHAAAKEARNGNMDIKRQVRHIGNAFSNSVEVSAQEAVYLVLQIPLTNSTRQVVFVNTSLPGQRIQLIKYKTVLDESDTLLTLKNGIKIKQRKNSKILRYVRFNVRSDEENTFHEKLWLFLPWRNESADLISTYDTYKGHYTAVKRMVDYKCKQYGHHVEELEIAREMAEIDYPKCLCWISTSYWTNWIWGCWRTNKWIK